MVICLDSNHGPKVDNKFLKKKNKHGNLKRSATSRRSQVTGYSHGLNYSEKTSPEYNADG